MVYVNHLYSHPSGGLLYSSARKFTTTLLGSQTEEINQVRETTCSLDAWCTHLLKLSVNHLYHHPSGELMTFLQEILQQPFNLVTTCILTLLVNSSAGNFLITLHILVLITEEINQVRNHSVPAPIWLTRLQETLIIHNAVILVLNTEEINQIHKLLVPSITLLW